MSNPFNSDDNVSQVRSRTDIVDLVSENVKLRKAGRHYVGLCPFHEEKTPSFTVDQDKQSFHCFGCGVGGDCFSYVMKRDNLTFPEALEYLARRAGITLKQKGHRGKSKEVQEIMDVLSFAHKKYVEALKSQAGSEARKYLSGRGLSQEIIAKFELGYAPPRWDYVSMLARTAGYGETILNKAGLIIKKDGGGYYDRFRNRIIFPIYEAGGRLVGFGGRTMGNDNPKYLNSPETPVFKKGKELFALNLAKTEIRKTGKVCLMEGYMDVISAFQNGVEFTVGGMGTALTRDQARALLLLGGEIFLAYDQDEAGKKAVFRSIEVFRSINCGSRVVAFEGAKDPDEYFIKFGKERFLEALDQALPDITFVYREQRKLYNVAKMEGKLKLKNVMLPILAGLESEFERDAYMEDISRDLGVDKGSLRKDVEVYIKKSGGYRKYKKPEKSNTTGYDNQSHAGGVYERQKNKDGVKGTGNRNEERNIARTKAEEGIIRSLVEIPELANWAKSTLGENDFADSNCRSVFLLINADGFDPTGNERLLNWMAGLCMNFGPVDQPERVLKDCVKKLKEIRLLELVEEIAAAQRENDESRLSVVLNDYQKLLIEVKSTKYDWKSSLSSDFPRREEV